jgi:hypothetical protein
VVLDRAGGLGAVGDCDEESCQPLCPLHFVALLVVRFLSCSSWNKEAEGAESSDGEAFSLCPIAVLACSRRAALFNLLLPFGSGLRARAKDDGENILQRE